ncbi:MAG: carbohydrate kinase [Phormidesmis sp.]
MSHAVCLGEILVECFTEQKGVPGHQVTSWIPLPGGAPANVACALAKLGSSADFVGAIGKDAWGDALAQLLLDMGVGARGLQRRLKAPTRRVYVNSSEVGDRTFSGFSEDDTAVYADAHLFADALEPSLFKASFLILGTLSLAYPDTRQSVEKAVEIALAEGAAILVDVNWRPMFWPTPAEAPGRIYDLLKRIQFLKVSVEEAEWLFGTGSARAIAQQLPGLQGVLIRAGSKGCEYYLKGNVGRVPAFDVDIEDTNGAEDAFTAGFVHQLMRQGISCLADAAIAQQVVTYASAVGALTTTRPGAIAALPTANEIEVFLYLN